jgi:hypothetical protein
MVLLDEFTNLFRVSTKSKVSLVAQIVDNFRISSLLLCSSSISLHRDAVVCIKHALKLGSSHHRVNNSILFFIYLILHPSYRHRILTVSLLDVKLVLA